MKWKSIKTKTLIIWFMSLAVISCIGVVFIQLFVKSMVEPQAIVEVNGQEVTRIALGEVVQGYFIDAGKGNRLYVEPGGVRMEWARCRDQFCVRQGLVKGGVIPIVCLPNRVVVRFEGIDNMNIDAVAG